MRKRKLTEVRRVREAPTRSHGGRPAGGRREVRPVEPWPPMAWPDEPQRIAAPTRRGLVGIRLLILGALGTLAAFLHWLYQPAHMGDPWLYWPLTLALLLVVVGWLFEWLYYWRIGAEPVATPARSWTVDVFTTACPGEPRGMIVRTLRAMQAIRYPHRSYLCDEGDDPELRAACEELGVVHVTRTHREDAKAGNINNALKQSDGEICVVLDPDHEPAPYFLDRVVGYFEDPSVGFVQTIQAYRNQRTSLVARGAAEMSYHFYGPLMMGMHRFDTAQAIGANCTFRRAALDSIGGHAPGLAEDMHTAMRLFSRGWRSVYVPEALTRGLVPSTLSSFYRQQLKWSCGVLELLLRVYPRVFRRFTWRRRLHFLLAPTYFMRGLVSLACLATPIACLFSGGIAWRISMPDFLAWALPMLGLVTLVRQSSQRFVLEPREWGLHVLSGVLAFGTWWVFLLGNLCALLGIRVPYIPTPKEGRPEDAWGLALPNFAASGLCVMAIAYGLPRDYTPYSLMMSAFAAWNAAALIFVGIIGQQKTLHALRRRLRALRGLRAWVKRSVRAWRASHALALSATRRWALALSLALLGALAFMQTSAALDRRTDSLDLLPQTDKELGGFYTGIYLPEAWGSDLEAALDQTRHQLRASVGIVSIYQSWGPWSLEHFPEKSLRRIQRSGAVPMITWEPWTSSFPQAQGDADLAQNRRVFAAILRGDFDSYILAYAKKVRDLNEPILMRFAHEPDNPQYPWSRTGGNGPDDFAAAFRYVVDLFNAVGASNAGWVYSPWTSAAVELYYPGPGYVDWVGVTLLNYGAAARDGRWRSFAELYEPFRAKLADLRLPVMLAEFGTTPYGGDPAGWLADALGRIDSDYREIRSLVFFHSDQDAHWISDWRPTAETRFIDWTFLDRADALEAVRSALARPRFAGGQAVALGKGPVGYESGAPPSRSAAIRGAPGEFELIVDDEPFYIRGVAYNAGGSWRNGNLPPTRRQLETDFRRIRDLGANTIRRYGSGWYDRNVLNVAAEHDLKVLYGFWFDQDLDYTTETERLQRYEQQVVATVRAYRDHPAVLGWSLGNEVWGLLTHRYGQPHLTRVRHAYVRFIEHLARRIHELDPDHPVFAVHEHSHQLAGAIRDFRLGAPSLDVIGINSYYERHIRRLAGTMMEHDGSRPYLVSEFGPEGYWHRDYTARDELGFLREPSSQEKAELYVRRWNEYVDAHRGANVGGVAFCWRDRYEATTTWFGMSDTEGRLKPSYYALRRAWTGRSAPPSPSITSIVADGRVGPPGSQIALRAQVRHAADDAPSYHWSVVGPDFRSEAGAITASERPEEVLVTLPLRPGRFRVLLQVRGTHGLDERSLPIVVRAPPSGATRIREANRTVRPPRGAMTRVRVLHGG